MKPQPMIAVANVEASSAWYQRVLGLASGHGGAEYEQLMSGREIVLQLHHWDAHEPAGPPQGRIPEGAARRYPSEHPHLGDPASTPYGNGVVLWFHAEAIDEAFARAVGAGAAMLEELKVNPLARHREFWLKDPDGYVVVVAGTYGDVGLTARRGT
jgi:catechol 2,3-dioxygenase-like lactoylglutathione lyase family enzyme